MDRFVVGTGRCGSTLLSRMLSEHPDLLSIFEFFTGLDAARRFRPEPVSGDALAELLAAEQPVVTMALQRGYSAPEIVYPFGEPGARYGMEDGLPWLLVTALSRMSEAPDALFDATLAFARSRPARPLCEHYRALFDFWAQRAGRRIWLERSGSSIEYVGALAELFPQARFLHLHRDGPDTALSMREHRLYRLAISFLFDLAPDVPRGNDTVAALGAEDPISALGADDPISARLEQELPVEVYGRYWSHQLERGCAALEALAPERWHAIRFEDLVTDPRAVLGEAARFLELAPGPWIDAAAALVRGRPGSRLHTLAPEERERLEAACAPGRRRLARD